MGRRRLPAPAAWVCVGFSPGVRCIVSRAVSEKSVMVSRVQHAQSQTTRDTCTNLMVRSRQVPTLPYLLPRPVLFV